MAAEPKINWKATFEQYYIPMTKESLKKKGIKLEEWKSTQNQEEHHFFRVNKGKGYQPHQYLFGYNPEVVELRQIDGDLWELTIKDG